MFIVQLGSLGKITGDGLGLGCEELIRGMLGLGLGIMVYWDRRLGLSNWLGDWLTDLLSNWLRRVVNWHSLMIRLRQAKSWVWAV